MMMEDRVTELEKQLEKLGRRTQQLEDEVEQLREELELERALVKNMGSMPQSVQPQPVHSQSAQPQPVQHQPAQPPQPVQHQPAQPRPVGPMSQIQSPLKQIPHYLQPQMQQSRMQQPAPPSQPQPAQPQMPQPAQPQMQQPVQPQIQQAAPPMQPQSAQPQMQQPPQPQMQQPYMQQSAPGGGGAPYYRNIPRPGRSGDMESTIGKQIMGVAASVLIFIGIILFAMLIIPNLTDELKMAAMFILSFAMTGAGVSLLSRKRGGDFAIVLTACGMGALYVSLFVCAVYFKAIEEIPLYLLLLVWIVAICLLSRFGSFIFHLVGVIGIVISVFFGLSLLERDDTTKAVFLTAYFIIGSMVFLFTHRERMREYITNICGILVSSCAMSVYFVTTLEDLGKMAAIMLLLFMLFFMVFSMMVKYESAPIPAMVSALSASFIAVALCHFVFDSEPVTFLFSTGLLIFVTWFYRTRESGNPGFEVIGYMWMGGLLLSLTCAFIAWHDVSELVSVVPVAVAVIVYGFLAGDHFYRGAGAVLVLINGVFYVTDDRPEGAALMTVLGVALALLPHIMMKIRPESYHCAYKNVYYCTSVYAMMALIFGFFHNNPGIAGDIYMKLYPDKLIPDGGISDPEYYSVMLNDTIESQVQEITNLTAFIVTSLTNSVLLRTGFKNDPDSGEREYSTFIVLCVMNAICLIFGMTQMNVMGDAIGFRMLYLIITLALLFIEADMLLKGNNIAMEYYIGIRSTIFTLAALASFRAGNYSYSVACFLLAIVGIVIGFFLGKKQLRIYFLVLSLLSVVKLVMFDTSYENSIQRALSFIVSGVLCLVISLIYQIADKKLAAAGEAAGGEDE